MIDKNYLKAVSCFDFDKYENNPKEIMEFKADDNLDYCTLTPCQYYTLVPETAETVSNTPWGAKPFPFPMEVLKCTDNINNIVQIITVGGEWRRRQISNSLETRWGEWINIEKAIEDILNNEGIQKFLGENWDRYMVIDKDYPSKRKWSDGKATIDEIIKQIKTGTAKIYRNKFIESWALFLLGIFAILTCKILILQRIIG
jgi:hypothetical protein